MPGPTNDDGNDLGAGRADTNTSDGPASSCLNGLLDGHTRHRALGGENDVLEATEVEEVAVMEVAHIARSVEANPSSVDRCGGIYGPPLVIPVEHPRCSDEDFANRPIINVSQGVIHWRDDHRATLEGSTSRVAPMGSSLGSTAGGDWETFGHAVGGIDHGSGSFNHCPSE